MGAPVSHIMGLWRKLKSAGHSIQGARENQEDYHGQEHLEHYAMGFMCDGHNGDRCSYTLGNTFATEMAQALMRLAPRVDIETVVQNMREVYHGVLEKAEKSGG